MKARNSLIIAMTLILALLSPVRAEDTFSDKKQWQVEFTGSKMNSTFSTEDLADAVSNLEPGDSHTFYLTLTNNDPVYTTDWYMSNKVLKTLEEAQEVAQHGGYTYTLRYYNPKDEETILYSSEMIGGENKPTGSLLGLHEATESLDEMLYLDTLAPKDKGRIELVVAFDGETQGNAYQDTFAQLQMNFAVEKTNNPTTHEEIVKNPTYSMKTGDSGKMTLYSGLALASGIGLLAIAVVRKKKETGGRDA